MKPERKRLKVSAIIPVHNGEAFLAEAVESVRRQTAPAAEIIIVDDGSTDGTGKLAGSWRDVRYVRQDQAGPAAARNRGVRSSGGDVVGFLDADDLWPPRKLEFQVSLLESDPGTEVALGLTRALYRIDDPGSSTGYAPSGEPWLMPLLGSALYRRRLFRRMGLLNESLRHSEDTDWFLRLREGGVKMGIVQEATLFYRRHGDNMTRDAGARNLGMVRALKLSLDRRRSRGGEADPLPDLASIAMPAGKKEPPAR